MPRMWPWSIDAGQMSIDDDRRIHYYAYPRGPVPVSIDRPQVDRTTDSGCHGYGPGGTWALMGGPIARVGGDHLDRNTVPRMVSDAEDVAVVQY